MSSQIIAENLAAIKCTPPCCSKVCRRRSTNSRLISQKPMNSRSLTDHSHFLSPLKIVAQIYSPGSQIRPRNSKNSPFLILSLSGFVETLGLFCFLEEISPSFLITSIDPSQGSRKSCISFAIPKHY
jgi:hypothetical protein